MINNKFGQLLLGAGLIIWAITLVTTLALPVWAFVAWGLITGTLIIFNR